MKGFRKKRMGKVPAGDLLPSNVDVLDSDVGPAADAVAADDDLIDLTDDDFVYEGVPLLPAGVQTIVWDYATLMLPKEALSAVIFQDRLLLLPIHEDFLDPAYRPIRPHRSVWQFLDERRREVFDIDIAQPASLPLYQNVPSDLPHAEQEKKAPVPNERAGEEDASGGDVVEREIDETQPTVAEAIDADVEDPEFVVDEGDELTQADIDRYAVLARGADVVLARPLRTGLLVGAPAVELSDVSVADESGKLVFTGVNLTVNAGELVVIYGVRTRASRLLLGVLTGLTTPQTGLVLHDGAPASSSVDEEGWRLARPGVLLRRSEFVADTPAVGHVAFPMLVFGAQPVQAKKHAAAVLEEVGAASLISQPIQLLTGVERHLVAVARALAGPWPVLSLHDPLGELAEVPVGRVRAAILRRAAAKRTVLVLTDDEQLLRMADRVFGVSDGQVVEAIRRS